jgi:hypothetical protein
MNFGGSGIALECYEWIRANIPDGSLIFEIGSGPVSTQHLCKHYRMISVEHDEEYIGVFTSDYVHAPLVDDWYDVDAVSRKLTAIKEKDEVYDLLLIDGPVGSENRAGFIEHIEMFDLRCPVIVDDIARPMEQLIAEEVSRKTGRAIQMFEQFAVI